MKIYETLIHPSSKRTETLPTSGFSWLVLMFGVFVTLARGQFALAVKQLVICFCTVGIGWIYFAFKGNESKYLHLLEKEGFMSIADFKAANPNVDVKIDKPKPYQKFTNLPLLLIITLTATTLGGVVHEMMTVGYTVMVVQTTLFILPPLLFSTYSAFKSSKALYEERSKAYNLYQ
jgi:hypothetical protein